VGGGRTSTLTGGSGRDILIGGGGPALLNAGKTSADDGDILIGGSTSYDTNLSALLTLMTEWSRTDIPYLERVQDLFGNGARGYTGPLLNPLTIARDTAINQLSGSNGMDWLWFSENGRAGDRISGYGSAEVATFE